MAASTQQLIDNVTKRLADVNREIDALDIMGPPTADLAKEEEQALKRLARREALNRVSSALSAELAELRAKLAAEKEAERQAQAKALRDALDAAKAEFINALYVAYDAAEGLKGPAKELDNIDPGFHTRTAKFEQYASRIAGMLEDMGAVKVIMHDWGTRRELRPVEN